MINYQEIIENLELDGVKSLLNSLDIPFKETDSALIMPTVCHNAEIDEASWKLYYYKNTHLFYCYTECGGMSIFKFLENFYETRGIVFDWYKDIYQAIINCSATQVQGAKRYKSIRSDYEQKKIRKELPSYPDGLLDMFVEYYPVEWLNDNISKEAMKKYNIRYSISQNKIIIPHYDIEGNLIGIRGRSLNEEDIALGKYRPVCIEGKMYNHPLQFNLYGLNFVRENIKKYKTAIVAESEKSCLQYSTMFGQDKNIVVAACGSTFHKYQLDLLIKCGAERVLIAFDKEGKTWEEKEKYFAKLKGICEKYKNYCTMGFVYDNSNLLKLKQSPFDCGPEVATKLISKGVWL